MYNIYNSAHIYICTNIKEHIYIYICIYTYIHMYTYSRKLGKESNLPLSFAAIRNYSSLSSPLFAAFIAAICRHHCRYLPLLFAGIRRYYLPLSFSSIICRYLLLFAAISLNLTSRGWQSKNSSMFMLTWNKKREG